MPTADSGHNHPAPRLVRLQMALGLLAAAITGVLLHLLWRHWDLPDQPAGAVPGGARPWGLHLFVVVALPGVVALPSLVLGLLVWLLPAREQTAPLAATALRRDAATYLLLPSFLLLPALWEQLGDGFLALGLAFLGTLTLKLAILLALLWHGFLNPRVRGGRGLGLRQHLAVFLVTLISLGLLAAWTNQGVSTASDEVGYLVITHSLVRHGTLSPQATLEAREYRRFYWTRWSRELAFDPQQGRGILFPFVLAPSYAAAGRLGVLVFFAALLGLAAGQMLAWLEEVGLHPRAAALAVGLVLASAPVVVLSQQVFPDLPALLLVVLSWRLLTRLERRPGWSLAGVVACALLMALLKNRLAPLAAGLVLMGLLELAARRWGWRRALGAALGLGAAGVLVVWLVPLQSWPAGARWYWEQAEQQFLRYTAHPWDPLRILLVGLALDQNYGLIFAAPVMLLAWAGLPAGLRLLPRPAFRVLVPLGLYLAVLTATRWGQWYGGFAGPARFLVAALPGAALFLGLAIQALDRPWRRLAIWVPAAFSLAYSWLLALLPHLRYSRSNGVNNLVALVEDNLRLPLSHLLPSTFTHSPALGWWLGGTALLSAGLAWLVWRQGPHPPDEPPPCSPAERLALPLLCGVLCGALLLAGASFPPSWREAEHLGGRGGALWIEWAYPPPHLRGKVLLSGDSLAGTLYFPGGPVRLRVIGRADADGMLEVRLGERRWQAPWAKGSEPCLLELGAVPAGPQEVELVWRSCAGRSCPLVVDRLELERSSR